MFSLLFQPTKKENKPSECQGFCSASLQTEQRHIFPHYTTQTEGKREDVGGRECAVKMDKQGEGGKEEGGEHRESSKTEKRKQREQRALEYL